MRAPQLQRRDGPDGLQLVETLEPEGDDLVPIDVVAAGVSIPDLLLTRGQYQLKPALPFIPGVEVAAIQPRWSSASPSAGAPRRRRATGKVVLRMRAG